MYCARFAFLVVLLALIAGSCAQSQSDFESYSIYSLAKEAKTAVVGDLSGDSRDDVAVAAWPSGLFVFCQQQDGSLAPPYELYTDDYPYGLAVGDLNADGRRDLAVGCSSGLILLYRQQAGGTFGLPGVCSGYGLVNSIVIDDLNGDGLADIADTSADYPLVLISLQTSGGAFALPSAYSATGYNARCICTLDANSDGRRDIAFLVDDSICLLTQSAVATFGSPQYLPAMWAHSLAAGDVTGDGKDDLVYTIAMNQPDAGIGVYAQTAGGFAASRIYPDYDYAQALSLVDVNRDGCRDVVAAHGGYEAMSVLTQNAVGGLDPWTSYPIPNSNGYEPGSLAVGDLNSDGTPDLAVVDWWNGLAVLWHKPGAPDPPADTTPPSCEADVSGRAGANGWYVSDVTVTITAQDEQGGSGLKSVSFTLDGNAWNEYIGPIALAGQGAKRVGYAAEDQAGNRSDVQWVAVKIDTKGPVVSLAPQVAALWPPDGSVVSVPVSASGSDVTSGLANLHLAVVDEYGLVQPQMDVTASPVYVPLVALRNDGDSDGRTYTLVLTGTDAAGNSTEVVSSVVVPRSNPGKPGRPGKPNKPKN